MPKDEHPPAFLLYVKDLVSDSKVEAMTTREFGAYFLLLCKAWYETPVATIPNNDRVLARWARLTPDEWAECRDAALSPFKSCPDNRLIQPRLASEYRKLMESKKKRATAGRAGSDVRWQKNGNRIANACECHDSANAIAMAKDSIAFALPKETNSLSSRARPEISETLFSAAQIISATPDVPLGSLLMEYPEDWVLEAIQIASMKKKRDWNFVRGICRNFQKEGGPPKHDGRSQGADRAHGDGAAGRKRRALADRYAILDADGGEGAGA